MKARDIMTTPVLTIPANAEVGEAADIMIEKNISCLPVVNFDRKLVGMITHTDFGLQKIVLPHGETAYTMLGFWTDPARIEEVTGEIRKKVVKDVMNEPLVTVTEDMPVPEVLQLMVGKRINRLPVVRGEEVVGIITRHDFLKLMTTAKDVMEDIWTPAVR